MVRARSAGLTSSGKVGAAARMLAACLLSTALAQPSLAAPARSAAPAPAQGSATTQTSSPGVAATATPAPPPGALVLYDPAGTPAAPLPGTGCGGFATPCNGLQTTTTATASASSPLLPTYYGHDWESGVNGVIGAGVSNHGTVEGGAVTAWLKKGDTTLALTVGVNAYQYNGKRYGYPYPPP